MRFVMRSLGGLVLAVLTLGLLALAVGTLRQAGQARDATAGGGRPAEERVFAVNVAELVAIDIAPVLIAYGDLRSARQLELRAETGGTLTDLAPGLVDGGQVAAGEVLYRVDPAEAEAALALAASDLEAARAEAEEARIGLELAIEETAAAERQRALRAQALARSEDLQSRGVGTAADFEAAQLALSAAEQALTGRRLARAQAEARIDRTEIAARRAEIARDEAARNLENTVAVAPFAGVLAEVDVLPGRLVSPNERLGLLIDPDVLEVAFRVSNAEYARLADETGAVRPLDVVASLEIDGLPLEVPGRIVRAGASVGAGLTGRLVYARLDAERPGLLRPGDFLTVRVEEPQLSGVAVVPATALGPEGTILVLDDSGERLEELPVAVLRRQGDAVILGSVPFGRDYVAERLPQLGPGIKVRPIRPQAEVETADSETAEVRLTPERRAGLIAALEARNGMPAEARARLRAALEAETVPQEMIDRLETRSGG